MSLSKHLLPPLEISWDHIKAMLSCSGHLPTPVPSRVTSQLPPAHSFHLLMCPTHNQEIRSVLSLTVSTPGPYYTTCVCRPGSHFTSGTVAFSFVWGLWLLLCAQGPQNPVTLPIQSKAAVTWDGGLCVLTTAMRCLFLFGLPAT